MIKLVNIAPTPPYLDAMQGPSKDLTELYLNTAKEYRSWQHSSAPRAAVAAGWAGWQGSGREVWHAKMA